MTWNLNHNKFVTHQNDNCSHAPVLQFCDELRQISKVFLVQGEIPSTIHVIYVRVYSILVNGKPRKIVKD